MSEDRQIGVPGLEPESLDDLRVEFGERGIRAAEFLETARRLLVGESAPVPKLGELIAFCIREALTEIPKASGNTADSRWRSLSRDVVDAAERYRRAAELPGLDSAGPLDELLSTVEELDRFHHEGERVHQRRLIALMIQRAGVEPLSSGTTPVLAYQKLLERVNTAAHGGCTVAEARVLWSEGVALLRQLFLRPEQRNRELDELAMLDAPSDADMSAVLRLAGTPIHLQRFLRKVTSPRWLWLFESSGVLNTGRSELWWSAGSAAVRLADTHRDEVLCWLTEMLDKHPSMLPRTRSVADAAHRLGGTALNMLIKTVQRHPTDELVVRSGLRAALELDPSDRMVEQLADVLMNEASWNRVAVPERLAAHVATGVNEENALSRIKMMCYKLRTLPDHDRTLTRFRYNRPGLIADAHAMFPHERSSVILGSLTKAVRSGWEWWSAADLIESTSSLTTHLKHRIRAWILAYAPNVEPDTITTELEQSIATRFPTGDDAALVDRANQVSDRTALGERLRTAMGDAPTARQVRLVLGSDETPPEEWRRVRRWVALLPTDLVGSWTAACQVLAERYGQLSRDDLLRRRPIEAAWVESPIGAEELKAIPPAQAADMIADWRPAATDWPAGARELARTLETLVKDDTEGWLSEPVSIATKLHHPTYISHYLQAAAGIAADTASPVTGLLDVVQMVWDEPYPAVQLGRDPTDYDRDWRDAQRSAVGLIEALARADADFGDRADNVWNITVTAARDISEPSWGTDDMDPFDRAWNRSCTRAFETAILFVAAERRASRPVRPDFERLLDFALRLGERNGEEYRAIVAPRIGWLRHVLPEWSAGNVEVLFGNEASANLGQLTMDLALEGGQPNQWILETCPEMIQNAVIRQVRTGNAPPSNRGALGMPGLPD